MIEELRIGCLGVIEESVLELGPGLCVVTGETGAGKTMLVTALGLLLGNRADAGAVRTGAKTARVEGVVRADQALAALVDELGGEVDDEQLLVARQVSSEGRSRAWVGGAAVPVGALSGLAQRLVAVHGQSDQHRLLKAETQRQSLDAYAGEEVATLLEEYAARHARHRTVEAELRDVLGSARERAREADVLRLGLEEVEAASPQAGEEVALAKEEARLGFADTLRTAAESARECLSAESGPDAFGAVATARQALDSVREHDPEAAALADRVAELGYLLGDVAADVASYAAGLDTDPARLSAVSERRAVLVGLTRKYGETVADVLAWAETGARRLLELDTSDERVESLRAERAELRATLADLAGRLSAARQQAGQRLADEVGAELRALAMPHARLTVAVTQHDDPDGLDVGGRALRFTAAGIDDVELLLAANTGLEARPLHKGASGGELSRVMLALEVVLAATRPVPTFVFDEVDAGVGGKAAVEVGRRLAALSRNAQVLVVTHLPQVAAFADRHVVVRKSDDGTVTTADLSVLDDAGRVQELSRMLAGLEESGTAMAHAQELLDLARESRALATG